MAHAAGKKEVGKERVLSGAARGFRARGYGGVGVDGLAREAGVTSGAFYAHFASKAEAFREVVRSGMAGMTASLQQARASTANWLPSYIAFYLGPRRQADLADSCTLQSLTGEVARADAGTRAVFQDELEKMLAVFASGGATSDPALPRPDAIALLALLTGAVSLTRAVKDADLKNEIAAAAERAGQMLLAAQD